VNVDVELSPDGRTLYVVDGIFSGRAAPDAADLAVAVRRNGGFVRLPDSDIILRAINTPPLEYAAAISSDGRALYYHLRAAGRFAIYRIVR
jgi:WD40-like Beta Propeller Repeat